MPHDRDRRPVRRALVSVYDKTGLEELARGLHDAGVALVSTGSTAARIADAGVPVTQVEELTGFPECLDGRVKTLHPRVHAGILADLRLESHREQLAELGVEPFDLVVANLYPFTETVASGATPDECVEQIDIGGPSMVRAAAKNHPSVAVVTSPGGYDDVLAAVAGRRLHPRPAAAARRRGVRAHRDVRRARRVLDGQRAHRHQRRHRLPGLDRRDLGEGARAALRREPAPAGGALHERLRPEAGLAEAEQLHGKEMSYNNYVDADAARRAAYDFDDPAVAIIKHANPCGIAVGADVAEAHRKAHACDPVSAFGGVIATNVPVTVAMAEQVAEVFTEVLVAPGYDDGAVEVLARKKNIRLLVCRAGAQPAASETRAITGGLLMQAPDPSTPRSRPAATTRRTGRWRPGSRPPRPTLADLAFAWRACRSVKSNAILLASDGARSASAWARSTGSTPAGSRSSGRGSGPRGSVAASDAFFPFADGLADPARGRRPGGRPAGRLGPRRRGRRGRRRRPGSRCTSPAPATSSTDRRRPERREQVGRSATGQIATEPDETILVRGSPR